MIHYLPGCDVRKNHPEAIRRIERYMSNHDVVIDQCCRVNKQFLNNGDTIINNCTLCTLILNETHPDNRILSLYEYILEDQDFPWINHQGEQITVQDCWRTRDNLPLQKAIRKCLKKMNYTIVEMAENFSQTKYCGVWLYNQPTKDCFEIAPFTLQYIMDNHIKILPEHNQIELMKKWVNQYQTKQILVYCNGCEKGIHIGGKTPTHIVELIAEGLLNKKS